MSNSILELAGIENRVGLFEIFLTVKVKKGQISLMPGTESSATNALSITEILLLKGYRLCRIGAALPISYMLPKDASLANKQRFFQLTIKQQRPKRNGHLDLSIAYILT